MANGTAPADPPVACATGLRLLVPVPGEPGLLSPVTPTIAAGRALAPLEQTLAEGQLRLEALTKSFATAEAVYSEARQDGPQNSRVLRGAGEIAETIDVAVGLCEAELLTAQPGGRRPPEILETVVRRNLDLLARGVAQRTLYQHAVWNHPPTADYIRTVVEAGGSIRTVGEMFDRVIICDRKVAFIPTLSHSPNEALEVRDPHVVHYLANVFECTWARGTLVDPAAGKRPENVVSELEQSIIRFLVAGHTEEKIARGLGISRRTVAEYISRISRRLGSVSRAQLGYLIATKGLLPEPEHQDSCPS
ncbi:helix-turn-helix transcriptional regulator [Streptomyces sp. JNUCC 64]